MVLSIEHPEADRLARELARETEWSEAGARAEIAAFPVLDDRSDEEIIGYDEHSLPN